MDPPSRSTHSFSEEDRPARTQEPISQAPTYYSHTTIGRAGRDVNDGAAGSASGSRGKDGAEEEDPADLPFLIKMQKLLLGTLNFYRIHMLAFIFIPFIFSGIFYASNTEYHISYIDCLFNCVSAMTVTGLATVNLSTLSGWQQTILFLQMLMGSTTTVSLIMIMVRKHFFRQEFQHIIEARRLAKRAKEAQDAEQGLARSPKSQFRRLSKSVSRVTKIGTGPATQEKEVGETPEEVRDPEALRRAMKGRLRWRDLFRHNLHKGSTFKSSEGQVEKPVDGSDSSHTSSDRPENIPKPSLAAPVTVRPQPARSSTAFTGGDKKKKGLKGIKISADMIKRVEGGGSGLMNPMGWYNDTSNSATHPLSRVPSGRQTERDHSSDAPAHGGTRTEPGPGILDSAMAPNIMAQRSALVFSEPVLGGPPVESPGAISEASSSDDGPLSTSPLPSSPPRRTSEPSQNRPATLQLHDMEDKFPRSKTIAFDDDADDQQHAQREAYTTAREARSGLGLPRTGTIRSVRGYAPIGATGADKLPITRTMTGRASISGQGRVMPHTSTTASGPAGYGMPRPYTMNNHPDRKYNHFGGFPSPLVVAKHLFEKMFPKTTEKIQRTMTMQRTFSDASMSDVAHGVKEVTWISFDAIVGRNSYFHDLTRDEYDELGGVEYRALSLLFWVVLTYWIGWQFIGFIVMAPYIAAGHYSVFQEQYRVVPVYWFAAFQSVSAFSNTGMSLVDTSMVPFATAYLMIVMLILLIYAGNTAFPTFLRLALWIMSKLTPARSRMRETMSFVLDHPRRCFIYLFPSKETWVLVFAMLTLTLIDFVSFMVLDIGNPVIESIPVGTRIAVALMQSAAVRAAGFGIVALNALAPAVKVLYVIMMYIAVYPISMTLRSTNVYEEQSLGIFGDDPDQEEGPTPEGSSAVLKYVGWHARRQLAFDVWWLAGSLWLVCIVERGALNNSADSGYFTIFSILFELVSAYSTTGLSLGLADQNYSLSGDFRIISKLIVCAVMIRGRHRGLPVAIDRAVMLPKDFTVAEAQAFETEAQRTSLRRSSTMASNGFDPSSMAGLGHPGIQVGGHRRTGSGPRTSFSHGTARPSFMSGPEGSEERLPHRSNPTSANTHTATLSPIFRPNSISTSAQLQSAPTSSMDAETFTLDSDAGPRGTHSQEQASRGLSTIKESGYSRAPTRMESPPAPFG